MLNLLLRLKNAWIPDLVQISSPYTMKAGKRHNYQRKKNVSFSVFFVIVVWIVFFSQYPINLFRLSIISRLLLKRRIEKLLVSRQIEFKAMNGNKYTFCWNKYMSFKFILLQQCDGRNNRCGCFQLERFVNYFVPHMQGKKTNAKHLTIKKFNSNLSTYDLNSYFKCLFSEGKFQFIIKIDGYKLIN